MSNFLAVATVTAALQRALTPPVGADVPGATVTTVRPDGPGSGLPNPGVNLFLYQVLPSVAARNEDLPTRGPDGRPTQRPRIGLDLHYLFTFYGRESDLVPQRLLGSVVRTLHSRPVLTRANIVAAKVGPLAASDLDRAGDLVKFAPLPLTLEELSKLWSVFFQTSYTLSVAYQGTLVLLEADVGFSSPLPVRARNVYVETFREPVVDRVESTVGVDAPILAGGAVRLVGRQLDGPGTRAVFDGGEVTPTAVTAEEVVATLPATLRAGLHGAQVQRFRFMGTPPVAHAGVESNVAPFVLTPQIRKVGGNYQISVANQATQTEPDGSTTHSADVTVQVQPQIGREQRVALLLNEMTAAADARAYTFVSPPLTADTSSVTVRARRVRPGNYLVRIQVEGATSPLDVVADAYAAPQVTL